MLGSRGGGVELKSVSLDFDGFKKLTDSGILYSCVCWKNGGHCQIQIELLVEVELTPRALSMDGSNHPLKSSTHCQSFILRH